MERAKIESSRTLNCVHVWKIEPPNGKTSKGVCSECGAEKEFRNSWDDDKNKFEPSRKQTQDQDDYNAVMDGVKRQRGVSHGSP